MKKDLDPATQLRLMDENIESYRKLLKDIELRAVMAKLQGKTYHLEHVVVSARTHSRFLEARRQKFLQQHPQLLVRIQGKEDNGADTPERDGKKDRNFLPSIQD